MFTHSRHISPLSRVARAAAAVLLLSTWLGVATAEAQSEQWRKDLEKRRAELNAQIKTTGEKLTATERSKQVALEQLRALQNNITSRQQMIEVIGRQAAALDTQVTEAAQVVEALTADLQQLRENYARMVRYAYRHRRSHHPIVFLLSAESFHQAFRRWQYLKRFHRYRTKQVHLIQGVQRTLAQKMLQLSERRAEQYALLTTEQDQRTKLEAEVQYKNTVVERLKTEEAEIRKDLAIKEKSRNELNSAIEAAIREEMAAARRAARAEQPVAAADNNPGTRGSGRTTAAEPEVESPLAAEFRSNRGRLPWPVIGTVTQGFGTQRHAYLNIETHNNGINIATKPGAPVRSVFEGTVTSVTYMPQFENVVIVSHGGNYFTVYAMLGTVQVKRGERISARQTLGTVYTNSDNKTEFHFELWQGGSKLNPATWLGRM